MALKRLDEEFELKPGTQLLPYMKRLLPSLEGRFQSLETERKTFDMAVEDMRAVALTRINEILIPATEAITEVTKLGFLLGPSTSSVKLELGMKTFIITEGPQRETFTPSPYVIVEREANTDDYAIARMLDYSQDTGELVLNLTAVHGNIGPHTDWVISSTPGMADSTKLYHDAVGPMAQQVSIDASQVAADKVAVRAAADALFAAGLDAQSFMRKDGTVPFTATVRGISPAVGASDTTLVTASWSRARMIEYSGLSVNRAGDSMTGPLTLWGPPTAPLHAATKAYVDTTESTGHWVNDYIGVRGPGPNLTLQSVATQQNRYIQANSSAGVLRWQMFMADNGLESGGNAGSNWVLHRYADNGAYLGYAINVARSDGTVTIPNRLDVNNGININSGGLNVLGDQWLYRPGTNTGALFFGNQRTAYHYWDGGTHQFSAGGISCGGSALTSGHINCYSVYTQGYPVTCWGLTSHGNSTINGQLYINNAGLRLYGQGSNLIELYDSDWGPMYIHHNGDLIGFLNNSGNWAAWVTNAGHMWTAQYGWIHDYVNNTCWNIAWYTADTRYNQLVNNMRLAYYGDAHWTWGLNQVYEPWGGGVVTGFYRDNNGYIHYTRFRAVQFNIAGGWYTAGY
jgi:hypothetical protein